MIRKYINIDTHPIIIDKGNGWFIDVNYNMLFSVKISDNTASYIKWVPTILGTWRSHFVADVFDELVMCLPDRGRNIYFYNMNDRALREVLLPHEATRWSFGCHIKNDNMIFAFSQTEKEIISINLLNYKTEIVAKIDVEEVFCDFSFGEKLYFLSGCSTLAIYEFSTRTNTIRKIEICPNEDMYRLASFDGDNYYFTGLRKKVLIWNETYGVIKKIDLLDHEIVEYEFRPENIISDEKNFKNKIFGWHKIVGDYVCLVPSISNKFMRINRKTLEIEAISFENEEEDIESLKKRNVFETYKYGLGYIEDAKIISMYSYKNSYFYLINIDDIKSVKIVDSPYITNNKEYFKMILEVNAIAKENEKFSINDYIGTIV